MDPYLAVIERLEWNIFVGQLTVAFFVFIGIIYESNYIRKYIKNDENI